MATTSRSGQVLLGSLLCAVLLASDYAAASAPTAPKTKATVIEPEARLVSPDRFVWTHKLVGSFSTSLAHNHNVPGIEDGTTLTLGFTVDALVQLDISRHQWLMALNSTQIFTKKSSVDLIVKSVDVFDLKAFYFYLLRESKRISVGGGLQIVTSLFPASLVTDKQTALRLIRTDGGAMRAWAYRNKRLHLMDAFSPFQLKQLGGIRMQPFRNGYTRVLFTGSAVAAEVWADGWSSDDNKATVAKEYVALQNYQQVGAQVNLVVEGMIKKHLNYSFGAELMFPFWTSIKTPISGFDLLNLDLNFKMTVQIATWASLGYSLSAKRLPMLADRWQVFNQLVLNFTAKVL